MIQSHMVRTLSLSPEEMQAHDGVLTPRRLHAGPAAAGQGGTRGLDIFGLQDRFEEFCDELSARYGLAVGEALRSNTTEPTDVPAGFADRIAEDNALDMELYDYACRLNEERHARARA
jgi:hypothetical protein